MPAPGTLFPPETLSLWARLMERVLWAVFGRRRVPAWLRRRYAQELESLRSVLVAHGVEVVRPRPVSVCAGESAGISQVFARDPIMVIGDTVVRAWQRAEVLRKERRGFDELLGELCREGTTVIEGPSAEQGAYLEGGDVLVDLPYVFVGVGSLASSSAGAAWLQRALGPSCDVVPVEIRDPTVFHLDTCLTLTGPRSGIVRREALQDPLPAPLDAYALVDVDAATFRQIGVNILMLGPGQIILQRRHDRTLGSQLRGRGLHVSTLDFAWHALALGAFRCATHPLVRG
jgi:glycine amidinotransferase